MKWGKHLNIMLQWWCNVQNSHWILMKVQATIFIECWQFLFAFIVLWWGKLKFVTLDHSPALKLTVQLCMNMMSIFMDSCNVMRGSKTGLETRIRREKAPYLLDIDGDVCHHVHKAAKAFGKPFKNFIEQLYIDLFNDFKMVSWFKRTVSGNMSDM